jgi:hypothetical protein
LPAVTCPVREWLTRQSSGPQNARNQAGDLEHAHGWQARQIVRSGELWMAMATDRQARRSADLALLTRSSTGRGDYVR